MDELLRISLLEGQARAMLVKSAALVEEARKIHDLSRTATAALGRLLTGTAMLGAMLKSPTDSVTVSIRGNGPMGRLLSVGAPDGTVKGYVEHPEVDPERRNGKLNVGGAVGSEGTLTVIKDMGLKEPYSGQTILVTSEIAEDLTYYFANSEQVPSSVGLGVLMEKDNTVKCAGGFIVQLMPFAEEKVISRLEENVGKITSVTKLLEEGYTPQQLLSDLTEGLDLEVTDTMPARFYCNCSKERVERAVASIGEKDIREMIGEGKDIEVKCHFCNTAYTYSVEELKSILERSRK